MKRLFIPFLALAAFAACEKLEPVSPSSDKPEPIDISTNGKESVYISDADIANCKLPGSEATLRSLRHVSRGRVFYMDYQVDFPWEDFTPVDESKRFKKDGIAAFKMAINETFFVNPRYGSVSSSTHACSGFVCKNGEGQLLFGRNLDGIPGTLIVSYNRNPRPGEYKSVMMTNVSFASSLFSSKYVKDSCLFDRNMPKDILVGQNMAVMDGMNEHGLCFAAYQLPNNQTGDVAEFVRSERPRPISVDQHTGKKQINYFYIPHLILSKCKTVDEVVDALKNSDFTCLVPTGVVHWYIADANNEWRILEYWNSYNKETQQWKDSLYVINEQLRVGYTHLSNIPVPYEYNSIENYYCNPEACTTFSNDLWQYSYTNKVRVHSMMSHYSPTMSEMEALECLQTGCFGIEMPKELTNWSCVYNPQERTILFNMYNDMSEIYSIDLKKDLQ